MLQPLKSERVRVNTNNQTALGHTTHACHLDKRNEAGEVTGPGALIGIGVHLDSGHDVFAQANQLEPAE